MIQNFGKKLLFINIFKSYITMYVSELKAKVAPFALWHWSFCLQYSATDITKLKLICSVWIDWKSYFYDAIKSYNTKQS